MSYQYTYLILDLCFFMVWLFLFLWRKDTRKEMLVMSCLFGAVGVVTALVYTKDWWAPLTITGTTVGIEDFLFGAMIGGISAVIYEDLFKKRLRPRRVNAKIKKINNFAFIAFFVVGALLFFGSFYFLKFNTLHSSILTLIFVLSIVYVRRSDLIIESALTGLLMLILSFFIYSLVDRITPGWINAFWYFKNVPNIIIFNVPIDDIIWYFLTGAALGPLYEYWQEGRLVRMSQ